MPGSTSIESLAVSVYTIPLDEPESDGTLTWDRTVVVLVQASAGGRTGLGFTYGTNACAALIEDLLQGVVVGADPMDVAEIWAEMVKAIRNQGRPGIASMAISAVDLALWDLKARLLDVSLDRLLGTARDEVPIYGSGGFTSLSDDHLKSQLTQWTDELGIPRVKIKVGESWGRCEERDLERVELARRTLGDEVELYVDANGGYTRKQAVRLADRLRDLDVRWFEEPVSSDDLTGLREIRRSTTIEIAAGEYGYDLPYFQRMCAAEAVDCLQIDVTRCGGITGFLPAAAVAAAHGLEVSAHCAPAMSVPVGMAVPNFRHSEYFADHVRAEALLFDGVLDPKGGALHPEPDRPGNGLELKMADAAPFRS